ncbi:MAG: aldehyde dehydrogenase family protein, partial [Hyphomonas sp.]
MSLLLVAFETLARFGIRLAASGPLACRTPITGDILGYLPSAGQNTVEAALQQASAAFLKWRDVPAPRRGELVRLLGEELREAKDALAFLVTLEAGKTTAEARGEVQEMIDICDFAV